MIDSYAQLLKSSFSLHIIKIHVHLSWNFPVVKKERFPFELLHGQDPLFNTPSFWLDLSAIKFRKFW